MATALDGQRLVNEFMFIFRSRFYRCFTIRHTKSLRADLRIVWDNRVILRAKELLRGSGETRVYDEYHEFIFVLFVPSSLSF